MCEHGAEHKYVRKTRDGHGDAELRCHACNKAQWVRRKARVKAAIQIPVWPELARKAWVPIYNREN